MQILYYPLLDQTDVPQKESVQSLASHNATMIFFLSTGLVEKLRRELLEGGVKSDTPVAIVYKATWPDEKIFHCTVDTLASCAKENNITKTALIIVGNVLGKEYERSRLYAPEFSTEFREASVKDAKNEEGNEK